MPTYNYLPGVQALTIDNGLVTKRVPTSKAVLIIGTAGQGPAGDVYSITSRATAAQVYGLNGTLIKAAEEVATGGSDNITLYRMGTVPASLTGIGVNTTTGAVTAGFNVKFGTVTADAATRYQIWYNAGVFYCWLDGNLVYAYDPTNNIVIDEGDLTLTGLVAGNTGLAIGTGQPTTATAVSLAAIPQLTGGVHTPVPVFTPAVTGLGLTNRQTYIALIEALDLLGTFPTEVVYCPDAVFDAPNVAYYVTADATTAVHNPVTNPNALDWLKTTTAVDGTHTYQWASYTTDSNGLAVPAMTANTAAARITAGFYEVHFPYALAAFCQVQEQAGLSGTCIGFIGYQPPNSFSLSDLRQWVGYLPTYSLTNTLQAIAPGKGLLGTPLMAGTTSSKLNFLCSDYNRGYRLKGFYLTAEGQYDGTIQQDENGNNIDIGAYLHSFADYSVWSNGWNVNYVDNGAGYVAGYYSTLDSKVSLTNKPVKTVQLWTPIFPQLDSLTRIGISVLKNVGTVSLPVLLHGQTSASSTSDYVNLLRQSIKGLVIETIRIVANQFIGSGSIDGLQQQSLITALTKSFANLQTKGYLSSYNFAVTTTTSELNLGHGSIQVKFGPAQELIQLTASVGIGS